MSTMPTLFYSFYSSYSVFRRAALGLGVAALLLGPAHADAQSSPILQSNLDDVSGTAAHPIPTTHTFASIPDEFSRAPLQPGYVLGLTVFGVPQMASELRVDEAGNITVPLAGPVHVAGETPLQAETAVANALVRADILKHPEVTLTVSQYTTIGVSVLGEVQNPGRIQLSGPKSLEEVLALAGGETTTAGNVIEIERQGKDPVLLHYAEGSSPAGLRSFQIQSGDTIFIRRAGVVYVLGAVARPGGYIMVNRGELNVIQAVSLAQGTTLIASLGKVLLLREGEGGQYRRIELKFKDMSRGKVAPLQMQVNDILYIPTSTTKTVLTTGAGLIGTATTAAIYRTP